MDSSIHSFDDLREASSPYLTPFLEILSKRPDPNHFLAESELVLQRALQSNWEVQSILGTPSRIQKLRPYAQSGSALIEVSQRELNQWVGFDLHRGCIGQIKIPASRGPQSLHFGDLPNRIVVAERHSDPANIGTLLRNARALGADLVVLDSKGANPYSRKTARASAGQLFTQPFVVMDSRSFVQNVKKSASHRILGATLSSQSTPLKQFSTPPHWVLCLGNEGYGLSSDILNLCDEKITIPMQNEVDSLNVAAATAVLLYALNES
jgi:tRNA G18 (ribose-2'-O)-methylase SpoU